MRLQDDPAHPLTLSRRRRGAHLDPAQHLAQNDPHLDQREIGAQASAVPAAERQPGGGAQDCGSGIGAQHPFRIEPIGLIVCRGTAMDQSDPGDDHDTRGKPIPAEFYWGGEGSAHVEHHGADPQGLLADRIQILVGCRITGGTVLGGLHGPGQDRRMPGQLLQGPGQRGGGGVVPGGQQRHQLITQLGVAHLSAVIIGGAHQHGQHVGPVSQVRVGATIGDLGVQQRVRLIEASADVPPRTALLKFRTIEGQRRPRSQAQHPRHDLAQRGQPGRIGGADDGAQDHLQGDLRHFRADRKLDTHRPPGDVGGGDLAHHRRLAGNSLPRERRHHQAAPVAVDVTIDDEH